MVYFFRSLLKCYVTGVVPFRNVMVSKQTEMHLFALPKFNSKQTQKNATTSARMPSKLQNDIWNWKSLSNFINYMNLLGVFLLNHLTIGIFHRLKKKAIKCGVEHFVLLLFRHHFLEPLDLKLNCFVMCFRLCFIETVRFPFVDWILMSQFSPIIMR